MIKVLEYGISRIGINVVYQEERNSKPVRFVADNISPEINFHPVHLFALGTACLPGFNLQQKVFGWGGV